MSADISPVETATGIGLAPRHLDAIQKIVAQIFSDTECIVYLFGSRVRGTHVPASDVDIAVTSPKDVSGKLGALRDALEFSTIPFFVDVVDLSQTAKTFAENVQNEGVIIWKN